MMRTLAWPLSVLLTLAFAEPVRAEDVPFLTGRVVDNAEILKSDTRRRITEKLRQHEQTTTNQIAVLTLHTLNGESIEEYAVRVFAQWKLGEKGKDNGVLVLVVPQDRRTRIEVGYGLEGVLPDAIASRIIRNAMTPQFQQGDFDGGIAAGVSAVVAQLEGDEEAIEKNGMRPAASPSELFPAPRMLVHEKVLLGAFIFGILGLFTVLGIVSPDMGGWFVYWFLIPFWAMFPVAIFGSRVTFYILIAYLVIFPIAKLLVSRSAGYRKATENLKGKGRATIGGFTLGNSGGGLSSGGSSSPGSSDDGFSGGGGRSGGGGASGNW